MCRSWSDLALNEIWMAPDGLVVLFGLLVTLEFDPDAYQVDQPVYSAFDNVQCTDTYIQVQVYAID